MSRTDINNKTLVQDDVVLINHKEKGVLLVTYIGPNGGPGGTQSRFGSPDGEIRCGKSLFVCNSTSPIKNRLKIGTHFGKGDMEKIKDTHFRLNLEEKFKKEHNQLEPISSSSSFEPNEFGKSRKLEIDPINDIMDGVQRLSLEQTFLDYGKRYYIIFSEITDFKISGDRDYILKITPHKNKLFTLRMRNLIRYAYIGETTRRIKDRVKEHFQGKTNSDLILINLKTNDIQLFYQEIIILEVFKENIEIRNIESTLINSFINQIDLDFYQIILNEDKRDGIITELDFTYKGKLIK